MGRKSFCVFKKPVTKKTKVFMLWMYESGSYVDKRHAATIATKGCFYTVLTPEVIYAKNVFISF